MEKNTCLQPQPRNLTGNNFVRLLTWPDSERTFINPLKANLFPWVIVSYKPDPIPDTDYDSHATSVGTSAHFPASPEDLTDEIMPSSGNPPRHWVMKRMLMFEKPEGSLSMKKLQSDTQILLPGHWSSTNKLMINIRSIRHLPTQSANRRPFAFSQPHAPRSSANLLLSIDISR